jgi:hypothetical protein
MSKRLAVLTAMLVGIGLTGISTSPGAATPVEQGWLSLHPQGQRSPVMRVKKHHCEQGCWGCTKGDCLKHKHTEYCETPPAKAECCTKWAKDCYCSPDFCNKQTSTPSTTNNATPTNNPCYPTCQAQCAKTRGNLTPDQCIIDCLQTTRCPD